MNSPIVVPTQQSVIVAHSMSLAELKTQVKRIREAMKSVMQAGVHYGVIPGTPKPTLYKPGAELLFAMFRISPEPEIEDLSTEDEIRYRVRVRGVHAPTGAVIGWGVGECSTSEDKYRWRAAVCDEEFDETDDDRRRIKWYRWKDRGGEWHTDCKKMVRTSPSDLANTALKMATKRGRIDLALSALGASDVFNQDLEDLQKELRDTIIEGEPESAAAANAEQGQRSRRTSAPRSRSNSNGNGGNSGPRLATEAQVKLIRVKIDQAGIPENEFLRRFQIDAFEKLPFDSVNDALDWIKNPDPEGDDEPGSDDEG